MFAWGRPCARAPVAVRAGQAPAAAAPGTSASSFGAMVAAGIVATGIVVWVRGKTEEKRIAEEHAMLAEQIDELEMHLDAEREAEELRLEQARVYGALPSWRKAGP